MGSLYLQDPDADLDYAADFAAWMVDGDTITTATWIVDPSTDIILDGQVDDFVNHKSSIFISGVTLGNVYTLTCRALTAAGRSDDRSFAIRCGRE